MICAKSQPARYRTHFSDGEHEGYADTTADKGGANSGFRPHELLEAALATCVSMTVRMYADRRNIPLRDVATKVSLDRTDPDAAVFRYEVEVTGDLTEEQKARLLGVASACPVSKTLSRRIRFEQCDSAAAAAID
ncbi:MAG: OsmC family protein [Terracidiphilus sp.]